MNKPPQIHPAGAVFTPSHIKHKSAWVEDMVPSDGTVLLFGASGVGKTTFACNLMNAVTQNQQFLGRNTAHTNCMFLSLDTPENTVIKRWVRNKPKQFQHYFDFVPYDSFDCLHPQFETSQLYNDLAKHVVTNKIGLVVVDSLRDVFSGEMNNDERPVQVYGMFQKWFNKATVVFIHHTRKEQRVQGKLVEGNIDDEATGSKYWINKAQVSLYLRSVREQIIKLQMGKTQCFDPWNEPIVMEMNGMALDEWYSKTAQYTTTYNTAKLWCSQNVQGFGTMGKRDQDKAIGQHLGVSDRWVRHIEAAAKNLV